MVEGKENLGCDWQSRSIGSLKNWLNYNTVEWFPILYLSIVILNVNVQQFLLPSMPYIANKKKLKAYQNQTNKKQNKNFKRQSKQWKQQDTERYLNPKPGILKSYD